MVIYSLSFSRNKQITSAAAKFGDSIIMPGVSREERAFAVRQQAALVSSLICY